MTARKTVTWLALALGDITLYSALLVLGVVWRRDAVALLGALIAIIGIRVRDRRPAAIRKLVHRKS
jgi:hypothetical protein